MLDTSSPAIHPVRPPRLSFGTGAGITSILLAALICLTWEATSGIRAGGAGAALAASSLAGLLLGALAQQLFYARKRHAAHAREQQQIFRAFGLTRGMVRDLDGRILGWGAGMEALYGYSAAMAVGKISHTLLATRFPGNLADIERALLANGDWSGELIHRCRDGSSKTVMSDWVLRRNDSDGRRLVIDISFDISALRQAETFLHLAMDSAGLGTLSWELGGSGAVAWDARTTALFGLPPGTRPRYALWRKAVEPEDLAAVEASIARLIDPADPLDQDSGHYRVRHEDGSVRWLLASRRAEFAPNDAAPHGRSPLRLTGTLCDITAAMEASLERERSATLLRNIVELAAGPIYAKDESGRFLLCNAAALALIGKPWEEVAGRTDLDVLGDPEEAAKLMANDRRVMLGGEAEALEEVVGDHDGNARVWLSTKTPMRGRDGEVIGVVGVSAEITERKRDEARRELMIHELNHRVKNTLATVQAVASETLQHAEPAMRAALEGRLMALASVHNVLTRESWHSAELGEVVAGALSPFGGADTGRFVVRGPPVLLMPRAAVALAMGLHELATNAAKYGALREDGGRVLLMWDIAAQDPPLLLLTWAEQGGPPVVPPTRRNFGTQMIEGALAADLAGTASIHFAPEGVRCEIEAPLEEVAARHDVMVLPRVGSFG